MAEDKFCFTCHKFGHTADTCKSKDFIREVTDAEHAAIHLLPNIVTVSSVRARSEREFDVEFTGTERQSFYDGESVNFSAWFPLAVIREMSNWTELSEMSDHPDMVAAGDWSGIRDSSNESIWNMFDQVFIPV